MKKLQEENRRLKQMYAELSLDHQLAKAIIEKSCKALSKEGAGRMEPQGRKSQCRQGLPRSGFTTFSLVL